MQKKRRSEGGDISRGQTCQDFRCRRGKKKALSKKQKGFTKGVKRPEGGRVFAKSPYIIEAVIHKKGREGTISQKELS